MKRIISILLTLTMVFALFAGCAPQNQEPEKDAETDANNGGDVVTETYKVVMMPKIVGMPIFESYYQAAKAQADELGIELSYVGPAELDASAQVNLVQDLISAGDTDALLICPTDGDALIPVLKEAQEAGIRVFTWDDDVLDEDAREYFINMCGDKIYGEQMGHTIGEKLNGKGTVGIVNGNMTANSLTVKHDSLINVLKTEYPDIEIVPTVYHYGDQQQAYSLCQDMLTAYPDLDMIAVIATPGLLGAAQAVQAAGRSEVIVYGAEQPNNIKEYMKSDSLNVIGCLWDVKALGEEAIKIVYNCLANDAVYSGDIDIEGYPEAEVIGTNITFNKVLEFDKTTVDNYDF